MNYTLHQLEIFHKIAQVQSVTKASEELFLTQPAVSIQLKNFQDQFQLPLFEIVGRKLYITEFGREIAQTAATILEQVQAINYKSMQFQGRIAGKLKIAIVSTAKYAMPYLLTDFLNKNEGVDLVMDVTNKASVIHSVENNEVDFAMVSTIPKKLAIESIQLMKNKLFLVGGKAYSRGNKKLTTRDLKKLPLIFRENGSATRLAMEQYLNKVKVAPYKKLELTSNEAVKQAVIAGLGVSVMPLIGIKNSLQIGELEVLNAKGLPLETNWNLIWLKSKNLSLVAKAFVAYVEENKAQLIKSRFDWFEDY